MDSNPAHSVCRARLAVLLTFIINGTVLATWVARIPAVQANLALSEGDLGLVLTGLSAGVLVALSAVGGWIVRFGSPRVTAAGAGLICLTLPPLALSPNPVVLWIVLFLFGAGLSVMDVAMNEQAVLVERRAGRPIMSSFHAGFSVGGLVGALFGAGMAAVPWLPIPVHFLFVALASGVVMIPVYTRLIHPETKPAEKGPAFRLPERALWLLGAVAFCSAIGEGAMTDWSGVYLAREMGTPESFAALGFAAFSLTMTAGRIFGDAITRTWPADRIVRAGGLASAAGLGAAVMTGEPWVVLAGFGAVGLGLANVIPLAFSAAGNAPGIPTGTAIAGVATIGYAGFLAGPPLIGLVAEATSLRVGLGLAGLLVGSLALTAGAVSRHRGSSISA